MNQILNSDIYHIVIFIIFNLIIMSSCFVLSKKVNYALIVCHTTYYQINNHYCK